MVNADDLPQEIVQPLVQLGRALVAHARAHRNTSLAEHEDGVLAAWRTVAPVLLEGVLQLATTGLEQAARPLASRCPGCEQRRGVPSQRQRHVQTRLGPIRLKRWWHHCWTCGHGWSPPDQALGLAPYQQTSTGLVRWQAALGAVTTFREAARLLGDLAGVEVGSETLRTHAERLGTELEGQQRAAMAHVDQTHEPPAGEHDPVPGVMVIETDGVMVRYRDRRLDGTLVDRDWHEVKVGLAGGWLDGHLRTPSYVAAREPALAFARRLGTEAARRGALDVVKWHPWDGTPAELRSVVVLGDGAKWIWEHVATLFGEERTEIVDWYHASEHIWTVAKASMATIRRQRRRGPRPPSIISGRPGRNPCWRGSMQPRLDPPRRVPSYSASAATSAPTRPACTTRHSVSGICRSDLGPSKPQPSTWCNSG
jgi:hypothetical protein